MAKKLGRPVITDKNKRTKMRSIRVSNADWALAKKASKMLGLTMTSFIVHSFRDKSKEVVS